jgi:hypothetical protein
MFLVDGAMCLHFPAFMRYVVTLFVAESIIQKSPSETALAPVVASLTPNTSFHMPVLVLKLPECTHVSLILFSC